MFFLIISFIVPPGLKIYWRHCRMNHHEHDEYIEHDEYHKHTKHTDREIASHIYDVRGSHEFRGMTFSKYKQNEVIKDLGCRFINCEVEPACYWGAELVCAGHIAPLWDVFVDFFARHIRSANPKLVSYLEMRINALGDIIEWAENNEEGILSLRNNAAARRLVCEVTCVLCNSRRKRAFVDIRVHTAMPTNRVQSDSDRYFRRVFLDGDPDILSTAVNELGFALTPGEADHERACFWIEYVMAHRGRCAQREDLANVAPVHRRDVAWLAWSTILHESGKRSNIIGRLVDSALSLFTGLHYSTGAGRKRRHLLFFAAEILTDSAINYNVRMIGDASIVEDACCRIDEIYTQVKSSEHAPQLYEDSMGVIRTEED